MTRRHSSTYLLALLNINLHEFVHRFLVGKRIHDSQVNDASKVDEVCFSSVLNPFDTLHLCGSLPVSICTREIATKCDQPPVSSSDSSSPSLSSLPSSSSPRISAFISRYFSSFFRKSGSNLNTSVQVLISYIPFNQKNKMDALRDSWTCNSSSRAIGWVIWSSSCTKSSPSPRIGLSLNLSLRI